MTYAKNTKEEAYQKIEELIERFQKDEQKHMASSYDETSVRVQFINPFFKALNWDVDNENSLDEVIHEMNVKQKKNIVQNLGRVDYSFKIKGKDKFLLEAKKPFVNLANDRKPAYQVRRYGWNKSIGIGLLSDFQELAIYHCKKKPKESDEAKVALLKYLKYDDYLANFDYIWDLLEYENVTLGSIEKYVGESIDKKGSETVDSALVATLDEFREVLASNISKLNDFMDERSINLVVQNTIDRILFLRFAEGREIEEDRMLYNVVSQKSSGNYYSELLKIFMKADSRYNSGLFDFSKDNHANGASVVVDDKVIKAIIKPLYDDCPYDFYALPIEILGGAYEQFLGKTITLNDKHKAKIEYKPEVRKAGGVYYTPEYIVEYIVSNTVGSMIKGKTPKQIEAIKILDPSCGSGSFLIGAYNYLLSYHHHYYTKNKPSVSTKKESPINADGRLTVNTKKRILINNIFGVDIDMQAVEVTKLSLMLKCLEGESNSSLADEMNLFGERALPSLEDNIKCGNSLIGNDFYSEQIDMFDSKLLYKINAFDWKSEYKTIFNRTEGCGFDCIIGNPPYVRNRELDAIQKKYFSEKYQSASGQYDLYQLFYEKGIELIKENSSLGFITSNKFTIASYGKALREYILDNCRIKKLIDVSTINVFKQVSTYPYIVILEKNKDNKNHLIEYLKVNKSEELNFELKTIEQNIYLEDPNKNFILKKMPIFFDKIEQLSIKLGDIATIKETIHTGNIRNKLITDREENETCKKLLYGRNVHRYSFEWAGDYIKYDKSLINKKKKEYGNLCGKEYFELPKLLLRDISKRPDCIFDNENFYSVNTLYSIQFIENNGYNYKYLLGLINSNLIAFYFNHRFEEAHVSGGFLRFKKIYTSQIPIRNLDLDNKQDKEQHDKLVTHVNNIINLKRKEAEASNSRDKEIIARQVAFVDNAIDDIVYTLYGLTDAEINIVENGQ